MTRKTGSTSRSNQLPTQLVEAFACFGPSYMRWVGSCIAGSQMSQARVRLLGLLNCRGPRKMNALSEDLGVSPTNVTALVDGLQKDGMVIRKPHPEDRRATLIDLTPMARKKCAKLWDQHVDEVAEVFSVLTETEQKTLLRVMTKLQSALKERQSG